MSTKDVSRQTNMGATLKPRVFYVILPRYPLGRNLETKILLCNYLVDPLIRQRGFRGICLNRDHFGRNFETQMSFLGEIPAQPSSISPRP